MMGLYGAAGRQNALYRSLWLLICVHLLNIPMVFGSSICQTETYTEAGTNMKKPCSVECANLINGGALDSIYNKNCKILCEGCYEYIASLRKSTTTAQKSTTPPSAVHDITFSNGTILLPTEPSSACECDGLKTAVIVLSLLLVLGVVIVVVALRIAWKKGYFKRCGRNGEERESESESEEVGLTDPGGLDDERTGGRVKGPDPPQDNPEQADRPRVPEPESGHSVPHSEEASMGYPVQTSNEKGHHDVIL